MSAHVAVVRNRDGLEEVHARIESLLPRLNALEPTFATELRNLVLLGLEVSRSALAREESRGAHYRSDFPATDTSLDHQHQRVVIVDEVAKRQFGPLHEDCTP
jgi:aspartate oxidase